MLSALLLCRFSERRADTFAHLGGGGVRERHDEQAVDRDGIILVRQSANDTLNENTRLARTCRGGNQDIFPARLNSFQLFC